MRMKKFCSILFLLVSCIQFSSAQEENWRETFSSVVSHIKSLQQIKDLSEDSVITLSTPDFAYVNIKGFTSMPNNRSVTRNGWVEVYDGKGHYFKKRAVIKGQGAYSVRYPKRNFSCEFCEKDWSQDYTTDIVLGDWVTQDAFHFKSFYTDILRGIGEVGYKLFDDMVADRDPYWERGGYDKESRARCYPDGFPCAVYFNGEYLGVFAWQLKKNHKNMNMKKKAIAEHIHIDGDLRDEYIFQGNIEWSSFDVRNPKDLYTQVGTLYDGNNPTELMDFSSSYYNIATDKDDVKASKLRSAKVKQYLKNFSQYCPALKKLEAEGASVEEIKREFEKRYDVQSLIDYYVFNRVTMNNDGRIKNWQWFTYDGIKWLVAPYDLDQILGLSLLGFHRPFDREVSVLDNGPYYFMNKYYVEDERQRYYELRESDAVSAEKIINIVDRWYNAVGDEYYDLEYKTWPESPCILEPIANTNWELCEDWEIYNTTREYNQYLTYNEGDVCLMDGRLWRATATNIGEFPYIRNTEVDSVQRIRQWVNDRMAYMDDFYGYFPGIVSVSSASDDFDGNKKLVGIYNLSGVKIPKPERGVNLYKYSDGTTRKFILK